MNRELFMRDLARFLSDMPADEREAALSYYEDYFADAGAENEQQVIEELGSPIDVAKQIKSVNRDQISYGEGSAPKNASYPNTIQNTASDSGTSGNQSNAGNPGGAQNNNFGSRGGFSQGGYQQYTDTGATKKSWTQNPGKVTLVIILAILAIPVGLPLLSALFGIAIAILSVMSAFVITFFALGGALIISGIASIICTVFAAVSGHYASSIFVLGLALIFLSVGLFLIWLGVLFCSRGIPAVWRFTVNICRSIGRGIKKFFS